MKRLVETGTGEASSAITRRLFPFLFLFLFNPPA
jgi:hypothetical protein